MSNEERLDYCKTDMVTVMWIFLFQTFDLLKKIERKMF